jgi:hypothetical protein
MGTPNSPGLIPRITSNLFDSIQDFSTPEDTCTVHISYFEIYNEQVRDLLSATPQQFSHADAKTPATGGLRVRERKDGAVFVEGLNEFQCKGFDDVLAFMKVGNKVTPPSPSPLLVWFRAYSGRGVKDGLLIVGSYYGCDVNERYFLSQSRRLHNMSPSLHKRHNPRIHRRKNLPIQVTPPKPPTSRQSAQS